MNSLPQSSHDQAWSMRPLTLNNDSSATSKTLPHCGQLGRPKSEVLTARDAGSWRTDWTIIVDLLDAFHAHATERQSARSVWRGHDARVKLPWPTSIAVESPSALLPRA